MAKLSKKSKNRTSQKKKTSIKKAKPKRNKNSIKAKGNKNQNKNKNNSDMCGPFKNKSHKGYEKNCVYERCKTCLKLKKGNYWDDTAYKSKNFRDLDGGPCKNNNEIVEYVDYKPQFEEMGMNGNELKNGFPAGSKKLKKYGLKNC